MTRKCTVMFKPEDKHKNLPSWEHVKNKKMTAK